MSESEKRTAVITGGANGIGRAIAFEMSRAGCDIVVADVNLAAAEKTADAIKTAGGRAMAVKADVSSPEDVDGLVNATVKAFGRIDILVNNAGITRDNLLMRMNESDWDLVIKVNLKGAFLCTQKMIRGMMKQRQGKIINISSVVGVMGNAGQANYSASKAGMIGLTKSIAKEVGSRNIQVNAVAPGYIETEMTEHLPEEAKALFLENIPAKRPGTPEDVAKVVAFLASPESDYITGQVLHVDGGMVM